MKWCKQFCRSNCKCPSECPKPYCYCLLAVISTSADHSWIRADLLTSTCQNKCFQRASTLLNWSQSHPFCRSPPMRRHYRDGGGIWIWPGLHYGAYHWHRLLSVLHRADLPAQPAQHHADAAVQTCGSIHGEQTRKTSKSAVLVCVCWLIVDCCYWSQMEQNLYFPACRSLTYPNTVMISAGWITG